VRREPGVRCAKNSVRGRRATITCCILTGTVRCPKVIRRAGTGFRSKTGAKTGAQARLYFDDGPVAADVFADEVNDARIPVVILNACQSGKETGDPSRAWAAGWRK